MVQKEKRRRGRPRAYDPEVALDAALEVFWTRGFAETTLDHLREATGMNRPSLYAAFGDKKAIFLAATERFRRSMAEVQGRALLDAEDPVAGLTAFFRVAVERYVGGGGRGCMVVSTTMVEAPEDGDMRDDLERTLSDIDKGLAKWLRRLQRDGVIANADVRHLCWQVSSTLLSLGIHARAGMSKRKLLQHSARSARTILEPALAG